MCYRERMATKKKTPAGPALEDFNRAATVMQVFTDPSRLRIIRLLASRPEPYSVTEITAQLSGPAQPTISHHLRHLDQLGIVSRERNGRTAAYSLNPGVVLKELDALAALLGAPVGAPVAV